MIRTISCCIRIYFNRLTFYILICIEKSVSGSDYLYSVLLGYYQKDARIERRPNYIVDLLRRNGVCRPFYYVAEIGWWSTLLGSLLYFRAIVFSYFRANCKKLKLRFSVHKNLILIYRIHFDWNFWTFWNFKSNISKIQIEISFTKQWLQKPNWNLRDSFLFNYFYISDFLTTSF